MGYPFSYERNVTSQMTLDRLSILLLSVIDVDGERYSEWGHVTLFSLTILCILRHTSTPKKEKVKDIKVSD